MDDDDGLEPTWDKVRIFDKHLSINEGKEKGGENRIYRRNETLKAF